MRSERIPKRMEIGNSTGTLLTLDSSIKVGNPKIILALFKSQIVLIKLSLLSLTGLQSKGITKITSFIQQ